MSEQTGAALELSRASTRITDALLAYADAPDGETLQEVRAAFADYATALGSSTTAMMAGGLGLVFKKLDTLTIKINDHTELVDHRFRAYSQELNEYRRQNQALLALVEERLVPFAEIVPRLEAVEVSQQQIEAGQRELAASQQEIITRLDADERWLAEDRERLDRKRERIDKLEDRVVALEDRAPPDWRWLIAGFLVLAILVIVMNSI